MNAAATLDPLGIGEVPPGGMDAALALEGMLVGLVLSENLDPDQLGVPLEDFYRPGHIEVLRAARAVSAAGGRPDVGSVCAELETRRALEPLGGRQAVVDMAAADLPADRDHAARAVRFAAAKRAMIRAASRVARADADEAPTAIAELVRATATVQAVGAPKRRVHPRTRRLCDVEETAREWLVPGLIPFGELTLLAGRGGCGKSTFLRALVSAVSTGAPLPDPAGGMTPRREPMRVLFFSREESPEMTIKPSVRAFGGDLAGIEVLDGEGMTDPPRPVTLRDLDVLDEAVRRSGAKLLVVDSLERLAGCDPNKANEVGEVLQGLSSWAQVHGVAVVCLHHVNKGLSSDPGRRISGSVAIVNVPRHVLVLGAVPEGPDNRRGLVVYKSNVGRLDVGVTFDLKPIGDDLVSVEWVGASDVTSRELMRDADEEEAKPRAGGALDVATDGLRELLQHGPAPVAVVDAWAEREGVSAGTLKRARGKLGAKSARRSAPGGEKGDGEWWVHLPGQVVPCIVEPLDPLGPNAWGQRGNQGDQVEPLGRLDPLGLSPLVEASGEEVG